MKPIYIDQENTSQRPLYLQIYDGIKEQVLDGELASGEKLPSLRKAAENMGVSLTTAKLAYDQLLVEGYVTSQEKSGYYVAQIAPITRAANVSTASAAKGVEQERRMPDEMGSEYLVDPSCFDFVKWKKCMAMVFNDYSDLLLYESDPQGEEWLRYEISKYLYQSRGVNALPENIVIGAGTQQITSHLCRILKKMDIRLAALEEPGYLPVQSMLVDSGFTVSNIPVARDGIQIEKLPTNVPCAVYVSPSNQFPTGAVMPVGRRYELIEWARDNESIIIEDDYDSELRYFGRPLPALQGLDRQERVVYLGSFSSTLFPAIKISYMVLPEEMARIFQSFKSGYTQTCSKAEQLTLALFMEDGYYYTGIRKLRTLYAQKLEAVIAAFQKYATGFVTPIDTHSGINLTLEIAIGEAEANRALGIETTTGEAERAEAPAKVKKINKTAEELCKIAKSLGLQMVPLSEISGRQTSALIFYYSGLPLGRVDELIGELTSAWIG